MNELKIRDAQLEDAERLVEIYSHYVLNTAVSFEYAVPSVCEFKERIRKIKEKYFEELPDVWSPLEKHPWNEQDYFKTKKNKKKKN